MHFDQNYENFRKFGAKSPQTENPLQISKSSLLFFEAGFGGFLADLHDFALMQRRQHSFSKL
jgi:hypothetical protein